MLRTRDNFLAGLFEKIKFADLSSVSFEIQEKSGEVIDELLAFIKQHIDKDAELIAQDRLVGSTSMKMPAVVIAKLKPEAETAPGARQGVKYVTLGADGKLQLLASIRKELEEFLASLGYHSVGGVYGLGYQNYVKEGNEVHESHLSTIISRVKHRLELANGDVEKAGQDPLFRQAVKNLQEYIEEWDDYSPAEREEADKLYALYANLVQEATKPPQQPKLDEGKFKEIDTEIGDLVRAGKSDPEIVNLMAKQYPQYDAVQSLTPEVIKKWRQVSPKIETKVEEQQPEKYTVVARGISDEQIAKRIATDKKGTVQQDDEDKEGKKFMVVVKEGQVQEQTPYPPTPQTQVTCAKCGFAGELPIVNGKGSCPKCKFEFTESKVNECPTSKAIGDQEGIPEPEVEKYMKNTGIDFSKYDLKELLKGIKVEKEHTATVGGGLETLMKIAVDHLNELPDYYTRLEKMEADAKAKKECEVIDPATADLHDGDPSGGEPATKNERKMEDLSVEEEGKYKVEFDQLTTDYANGKFNFNQLVDKLRELNKSYGLNENLAETQAKAFNK